jgi:nicotinamidase-related amidase
VVHTRQGNAANLEDLPAARRAQDRLAGVPIGDRDPLGRGFVRGERGWEIDLDVAPANGVRIVDKPRFGAFTGTDLDPWLATTGSGPWSLPA